MKTDPYPKAVVCLTAIPVLAWLFRGLGQISKWVSKKKGARILHASIEKRLGLLSVSEKKVLDIYVKRQTYALALDMYEPTVALLIKDGMLFQAADISYDHFAIAVALHPYVREHLNKQSGLLRHSVTPKKSIAHKREKSK
jgi:hypothetical protein